MRPNHEYASKCIRYDLPILINNAPIEIIEKVYTHILHGFALYIKLKTSESYQEHCTITKTVISAPEINKFYVNYFYIPSKQNKTVLQYCIISIGVCFSTNVCILLYM